MTGPTAVSQIIIQMEAKLQASSDQTVRRSAAEGRTTPQLKSSRD